MKDNNNSSTNEINNIQDYFKIHGGNWMVVWSRTPNGNGSHSEGYFTIEDFTEQTYLEDVTTKRDEHGFPYEYETFQRTYPVLNFKCGDNNKSCSFSVSHKSYQIYLGEEPTDKWGNSCDFNESGRGCYLIDGCYEVFSGDSSGYYLSESLTNSSNYKKLIKENDLEDGFLEWLTDYYYYNECDFISCISLDTISSGCCETNTVVTTNRDFDGKEWLGVFNEYLEQETN